ncbi:hypothetical protein [Vibrio tritonius]|uniref:hypothetical protein n=1 Tax=Vibrio tritonius TaxID=1435069 RepID=UPI0012E3E607|nr:hypothetical protein [Vibrio tritonius]
MQTSELHQRAQVKLNDGRNGHSLSTSLGAEMGLLMSYSLLCCVTDFLRRITMYSNRCLAYERIHSR